jgi:hypothetical protein
MVGPITGLDEHRWIHLNSIRPARSIDGDHAKCFERIDGGIHATQSFSRYPVELSIREPSIWIVDENV